MRDWQEFEPEIARIAARLTPDEMLQEDLAQEGFRYFAFEDVHRGPPEVVKQRQQALLQFFPQCRDVLDVGCGRGEFLELAGRMGMRTEIEVVPFDEVPEVMIRAKAGKIEGTAVIKIAD